MLGLNLGVSQIMPARWWPDGGSYSADFITKRYMSNDGPVAQNVALSFQRGSPKHAANSAGVWLSFAADEMAITDKGVLLEPEGSNAILDNVFSNVVDGEIGAGATGPTGWSFNEQPGVAIAIVGHGSDDGFGLPYIDIRTYGTNSTGATVYPQARFWNELGLGANGETVSARCYGQLLDVTTAPSNSFSLLLQFPQSGGGYSYSGVNFASSGSARELVSQSRMIGSANSTETTCNYINYFLSMPNGSSVDVTRRLSGMQLERADSMTSVMLNDGIVAARAADALTLHLPAGTHDVTMKLESGGPATLSNQAGDMALSNAFGVAIETVNTTSG